MSAGRGICEQKHGLERRLEIKLSQTILLHSFYFHFCDLLRKRFNE